MSSKSEIVNCICGETLSTREAADAHYKQSEYHTHETYNTHIKNLQNIISKLTTKVVKLKQTIDEKNHLIDSCQELLSKR